jgi:hypothetical protein
VSAGLALAGCVAVKSADDAGTGSVGKEPGKPFAENVCFKCTLEACAIQTNACATDLACATWARCVGACPTANNGVSADSDCLTQRCGLPGSASVLAQCITDYSTGLLTGCIEACTPPPVSD